MADAPAGSHQSLASLPKRSASSGTMLVKPSLVLVWTMGHP